MISSTPPRLRAALAKDRRWLRQKISALVAHQPMTAAFERAPTQVTPAARIWYRTQKEHWLGWLDGYRGRGAYGRKNWHRSAEFVYNHIGCPAMLIWLAEAAGLPKEQISSAVAAALQTRSNFAGRCAALRRRIPWRDIEQHLRRIVP
jgi:hypothetical protein